MALEAQVEREKEEVWHRRLNVIKNFYKEGKRMFDVNPLF